MATRFVQPGNRRNYTPSGAAKTSGQVVELTTGATGEIGVCEDAIADGATGIVQVSGVHRIPKISGALSAHAIVYWDADGNPVGGTAGTGAVTSTSTGNTLAGRTTAAASTSATTVDVLINDRCGSALSD